MASKRGQKRRAKRKACDGKVAYEDQTKAVANLISLKKKKGETNISSYKCEFCGRWHVGHMPGKLIRSIRDRDRSIGNWSKRLGD